MLGSNTVETGQAGHLTSDLSGARGVRAVRSVLPHNHEKLVHDKDRSSMFLVKPQLLQHDPYQKLKVSLVGHESFSFGSMQQRHNGLISIEATAWTQYR